MEQFSFLMTADEVKELRFIAERIGRPFEELINEALREYRGFSHEDGALRPPEFVYSDLLASVVATKPEGRRKWDAMQCRRAVRAHFEALRKDHGISIPLSMLDPRGY